MINMETRKYRITGIEPILGSQPANPEIRSAFIASKAPAPELRDEESAMFEADANELRDKGLTVFLRNPKSGAIALMDYAVKGMLKANVTALEAQNKIKQGSSKVGKYVFVAPRIIDLMDADGNPIKSCADDLERPLRAKTMKGDRVALTSSEEVLAPWQIEVSISLVPNKGSEKSASVTWEAVEDALDYGELNGIGQWHNGGYGRFTWERIG